MILTHILARGIGYHVQRIPGAVIEPIKACVTSKVFGFTTGSHAQNGFLRTDRHQNEFVAPIGHVYKENIFCIENAIGFPARVQHLTVRTNIAFTQRARRAIDGLIQLPVRVCKVIQWHVTRGVENCPLLCIAQLRKRLVGCIGVVTTWAITDSNLAYRNLFVACIRPVHHFCVSGGCAAARVVIQVVNALNQHFDKFKVVWCCWIEIPNLLQSHIHGLVAAAHHHALGTHLLGNLGGNPSHFGHQDHTIRHLDGVNHHLNFFFYRGVNRHQHGLNRTHIGIGIESDAAPC